MRTPTELTEAFRSRGLKVTPQRQAVFEALYGTAAHPSADSVYAEVVRRIPTVSLRTVYQTLNELAEMGEINSLDLGTGAARFDPNIGDHHHLVCTVCGLVKDVHPAADVHLPQQEAAGFSVLATEIVFRGVCEHCRGARTPQTR
jgi:Fe2+ or Zn2+ uptake regulation protein